MSKARLMQGNEACAEGAIAAGVNFFAGYPITPSTEIAETMARLLPKHGGKFVQMEDEIASMGAILGASLAGSKVMDATSGPGFSLKQELIGYAACAEIPCVLVDVQRVGPSTGQPTSPSQGDVMQARWGTHGDHPIIALAPWSVRETYDATVMAVNYAERFRTPVILLMDEVIGHLREKVELPDHVDVYPRRKPKKTRAEGYEPFAPDEDLVPNVADFGQGYRIHVTGLIHDDTGFPSGSPEVTESSIRRLHEKIARAGEEIIHTECSFMDDAEYAVVAFGGVLGLDAAALKARIDYAIAFARLEQVTGKRAELLSGGLRRRLNLAIGLLGKPELLLLDEPTVGVDPQSRSFLLDAIAGLPASGTTVLYTSHYMEEVEAICQRVAIVDQGKVLAEGALDDLLRCDESVAELALGVELPAELAARYQATAQGALTYRLELPNATTLPRLLDELAAAGCPLHRLNVGRQNLEQLFMRLTRRSLRD